MQSASMSRIRTSLFPIMWFISMLSRWAFCWNTSRSARTSCSSSVSDFTLCSRTSFCRKQAAPFTLPAHDILKSSRSKIQDRNSRTLLPQAHFVLKAIRKFERSLPKQFFYFNFYIKSEDLTIIGCFCNHKSFVFVIKTNHLLRLTFERYRFFMTSVCVYRV